MFTLKLSLGPSYTNILYYIVLQKCWNKIEKYEQHVARYSFDVLSSLYIVVNICIYILVLTLQLHYEFHTKNVTIPIIYINHTTLLDTMVFIYAFTLRVS